QRRGDPPRLERVRRVGARSAGLDAELGAGLEDRVSDLLVLRVRAPQLETRGASHAVAQRAHTRPGDVEVAHVEELDLLERTAVELLDDRPGVRPLDLEAVVVAGDEVA